VTKQERTKEIILQLKQSREERDLSISEIYDMMMAANCDISMTTLKRVFAEGSEDKGFRYKDTIQPIAQVMLAIKEETTADNQLTDVEIDALKNIVLLKDTMIDELTKQQRQLAEQYAEAVAELEECKANFATHRKQLEVMADHLQLLADQVRRKDKCIDELLNRLKGQDNG
jgi:hypothetical protein